MPIKCRRKNDPYSHLEVVHVDSGDRLCVVPERGGLITEWCSKGKDILYFDLERFRDKNKSVRGGIPILFPICGELSADRLQLDNRKINLNQHGFARDHAWKMKLIDKKNSFALTFSDNEMTRASYPYLFSIEMEIRLEKSLIDFSIIVHNRGQESMPFSFGLHPYFNISDLSKIKLKGLSKNCIDQHNMIDGLTSDQTSNFLDGVDFLCGPSKSITITDSLPGINLLMQQQEPMDLTVVWTDPPRSMICVEPWTSPRNSLVTGEKRLLINPGSKQKLSCRFCCLDNGSNF